MVREWKVRVVGPLAPYAVGFKEDLVLRGYRCAYRHLYLMAHVSRWLRSEQLEPGDLSVARLARFDDWRMAGG